MAAVTNAQLNDVKQSGVAVRVHRSKVERGVWIDGFVVDYSDGLILIEVIDSRILLDGYNILRRTEITRFVNPNPRNEFYKTALHLRGERRKKKPNVELKNIPCVLESIGDSWPLIAIHREVMGPGKCFVGRVVELGPRSFEFETIDPHAVFDGELESLKYADITRIDFGGGYEEALALVAGLIKPSKINKRKTSR